MQACVTVWYLYSNALGRFCDLSAAHWDFFLSLLFADWSSCRKLPAVALILHNIQAYTHTKHLIKNIISDWRRRFNLGFLSLFFLFFSFCVVSFVFFSAAGLELNILTATGECCRVNISVAPPLIMSQPAGKTNNNNKKITTKCC